MTDWYDSEALPQFENPPVVEAALAIEFGSVPGLDVFQLARLQSAWEDRFPSVQSVQGAPPTPLNLDPQSVQVNFGSPAPRMWATGQGQPELLVQTQSDRLILNWRRDPGGYRYPGYFGALRGEYARLWEGLQDFLRKTGLPSPSPVLAEYNYVNAVPLEPADALHDVVTLVRPPEEELPGQDQFGQFQFLRNITASELDPYTAQIHISGQPQNFADGSRQLVFTIVARAILGAKADDPLAGLDAAHALASHTFARIVTKEKQEQWGRLQ